MFFDSSQAGRIKNTDVVASLKTIAESAQDGARRRPVVILLSDMIQSTPGLRFEAVNDSDWDIRREGRAWHGPEAMARYELTPEKLEMSEEKLLWFDEDRVKLLGLLLENVGADRAVRLGNPAVWRAAVAALDAQ